MFASGDSSVIKAAQATLYKTLEISLRLLSPFMPFITEELYQRLPKSSTQEQTSICVSPYPDAEEYLWKDTNVETEVDFIQKVAKAVRSARSDYNLPNKTKTEGI